MLIDFFTTWCGPCKKLDQVTWKDEEVRQWLANNTIALKIDAENESELAQRFSVEAYPTIVLVKPDGKVIDRLIGYRPPKEFLKAATNSLAAAMNCRSRGRRSRATKTIRART